MKRTKWVRAFGCLFAAMAIFALVLAATPLFAQEAGTILGVVKDTSGGSVPSAKITVTNTETNESRTTTTGDDGAWRVPGLNPGHYSVRIEKDGFKSSTQTGLTLDVAQQLVVNPTLEVGAATQEVTVTGEAPLVNTTTSSLGGLVNDQRVADLPLNGRNYIDLTLIQPGVQENTHPAGGGAGATGTWYSSNGAPPRSNNFTMDGAILTNQYGTGANSEAGTTLGVDGIKEYKVVTSMFSAQYGLSMGSQMVIVSKSGTNNWHGDIFEYLRNSTLDARNFFDTGVFSGGPRLPEFQRNNFGGSAGGPIQKDKTFFYLVYEGLRARTGATITDTEPNAACHNLVPIGNGGTTVGQVVDIGQAGPVFPNGANLANPTACYNGSSNPLTNTTVIPATVQPWLGQLPIPLTSASTNNFTYPAQFKTRVDYTQLRVDHHFGVNDTLFGRYTFDDAFLDSPFANIQILTTGSALPQYNTIGRSRNQWTTIGEDHILSPTILNSVRLSFSRTNFRVYPENETVASLGGNPLNPFGPLVGANWSAVPGYGGAWSPGSPYQAPSFLGTAPAYHVQNLWTLSDDIFVTHGKNAFMFGTLMNNYQEPNVISKGLSGGLVFSNLGQFMSGQPSGISAFISPYPGYTEGCPPTAVNTANCSLVGNIVLLPPYNGNSPDRDFMYKTFGFYVQDDYRATSRLTVNAGLRYEYQTTFHELYGRESALLDIQHSSTTTPGLMMDNPSLRNFSPRVGFAWDVFGTGKTSVRSGFGVYYDVGNYGALLTQAPTGFPPFSAQTNFTFTTPVQLTNAATDLPINYGALVPQSSIGRALQGNDYNMKQPYSLQYNLTVEQQLPGGLGLSVSYVGNRGIHLITGEEGNPTLPYAYTINGSVQAVTIVNGTPQLPNGWQNGVPQFPVNTPIPGSTGGTGVGGCYNNSLNPAFANTFTGTKSPCRINPYWGSFELYTAGAESWYNSLQVLATKRLSHGLDFQAAYTWSHAQDTTQGQMFGDDCAGTGSAIGQTPGSPQQDKANACFNAPNSLHVNFIYHLPTIKDNGFLSKAVNGWWVSTIATAQQGFPQTPALSNQRSYSGNISQSHADDESLQTTTSTVTLPVTLSSGTTAPNCSTATATCTYTFVPYDPSSVVVGSPNEWFNPLMFTQAPLGQLGNSGRNTLPGPNEFEWDLSVVKDTRLGFLGEQGNLEFRAEFFNVLNHANFGPPGTTFYTGSTSTNAASIAGGNLQAPNGASTSNPFGSASTITTTRTTSRQIQLALKLIF